MPPDAGGTMSEYPGDAAAELGGMLLVPRIDLAELFLAFVIGGMCAGAVTTYSTHLPTLLAFILPASLPVAARFAAQQSPVTLAMGGMVVVFAIALSVTGCKFS